MKLKIVVNTPRGWHRIAEKFGADMPQNTSFKARQATGEIYSPALATQYPECDPILSRIYGSAGLEAGFNQGEGCYTYQRYIYIHGTPDTEPMGILDFTGLNSYAQYRCDGIISNINPS